MSLLSLSYEALKERKLRTTLTILMVIMGGSLLVAVNGISTGALTYIDEQFAALGANLLAVTPRGEDVEIDDRFVSDIAQWDGVMDVVPFIQQVVTITSHGESQSVVAVGLDQSKLNLIFPTLSLEEGTLVSPSDKMGILLGNQIVYSSKRATPFTGLGQVVKLTYVRTVEGRQVYYEKSFSVRGILKYLGSGFIPVDQTAFISLSAARSFFNRHGGYDGVYVITEDPSLNEEIRDRLRELYNVNVLSPKSIADMIMRISSAVSFFVDNIAAVSLLVASVGIVTTLWTSMMERIREIGILKAIGFSNEKILRLFLNEAIIIGLTGGTLGLFTGVGLAYVIKSFFRGEFAPITPIFTIPSLIGAWILCVVLSMISGFYPAWRASRLDPVASLRYE